MADTKKIYNTKGIQTKLELSSKFSKQKQKKKAREKEL